MRNKMRRIKSIERKSLKNRRQRQDKMFVIAPLQQVCSSFTFSFFIFYFQSSSSSVPNDNDSQRINRAMDGLQFKLPEFTENYKLLLVEELVLVRHPAVLHWGNCKVIGRVQHENLRYFLENIQLECFGKEYKMPTGAVNILLLTSTSDKPLPVGRMAEVYGQIVLCDKSDISNRGSLADQRNVIPTTTSCHLMELIRDKLSELEDGRQSTGMDDPRMDANVKAEMRKYLVQLKSQYEPAIHIMHVNAISDAEELITCDLGLRLIDKMRQPNRTNQS